MMTLELTLSWSVPDALSVEGEVAASRVVGPDFSHGAGNPDGSLEIGVSA